MCSIAGLTGDGKLGIFSQVKPETSAKYHPPAAPEAPALSSARSCPMRRPCFWPCLLGAVFGASLADRASMCPSGCNGRGFCDDATCVCYPG